MFKLRSHCLFKDVHMKQTFKQATRPYQAIRRPDPDLKSKHMTGRRPGSCLRRNWRAKLRPCKV